MENKTVRDTYYLNKPYQLKSISSDFINMSCYGYHFTHWEDEEGNTLEDKAISSFVKSVKDLSAIWEKNRYNVKFFIDGDMTPVTGDLSSQWIPYKESAIEPEHPSKAGGYIFSQWSSEAWKRVLENSNIFAIFAKTFEVKYFYTPSADTYYEISTYLSGDHVDVFPIEHFEIPLHTIYGYIFPEGFNSDSISVDANIEINTKQNKILHIAAESSHKDDTREHGLSVTFTTTYPQVEQDSVSYKYSSDGETWVDESPKYTEEGSYDVWVSAVIDNYFQYDPQMFTYTITEADMWKVRFCGLNTDETLYIPVEEKDIATGRDYPEPLPVAPNTISSDFTGWIGEAYKNVTTNVSVYPSYTPHDFHIYLMEDDGTVLSDFMAHYNDNVLQPAPSKDGFNFEYWATQNVGYEEDRTTENPALARIIRDVTAYAFYRKYFNASVVKVYDGSVQGDIKRWTTAEKSKLDHDNIMTSEFSVPEIPYYSFKRFEPEAIDGKWLIDHDNFEISAIYEAKTGRLTYHSHYPEI